MNEPSFRRRSLACNRLGRVRVGALFATLWLAPLSCVDLNGVREFADLSVQASDPVAFVVRDFQDSQRREFDMGMTDVQILPDSDAASLLAVEAALRRYCAALATVASNDFVSYDTQFENLSTTLVDSAFIDPERAAAYSRVASTVAETVTRVYRHSELRNAISARDADVGILIDALVGFVENYEGQLEHEGEVFEDFLEAAGPNAALEHYARSEFEGEIARRGAVAAAARAMLLEMKKQHAALSAAARNGSIDLDEIEGLIENYRARVAAERELVREASPERKGGGPAVRRVARARQ